MAKAVCQTPLIGRFSPEIRAFFGIFIDSAYPERTSFVAFWKPLPQGFLWWL
jgi:hypothetical protein